ncbi:DUF421 domain-containing protein [Sporosarcina luteola]|uniref:DUF421 domain-containing protein n=1 Tax=Sporosarcina luteola TaxID=582850 RepID=A0A511Z7Y6_9BACL|nr:YetF domain-containing protein [Sporosarcina luteola]GEN83550.1 DUF421 domain-containing protein [Sporosarcina luteola]
MIYIWETILIFIVGTILLRFGGRKSISQMTIPQTIIMIAIGTLLIQPVSGHGLWTTLGLAALLILCLIVTEMLQLKSDKSETVISGKAVPVIVNGAIDTANLKKLRLTVDKLEARFRQAGISSMKDVQYATLEASGQLGYMLKESKQPATKEDIQRLISLIQNGELATNQPTTNNIFTETLMDKQDDGPKYLQ